MCQISAIGVYIVRWFSPRQKKKPFRESGRALFFHCDESLLSGAGEKIKTAMSEANERFFLFSRPMEVRESRGSVTSNILTLH
jgi:hypothetical protein